MNPNSLKNLVPGNNKPYKKRLTKQIQAVLTEYLTDNFADFSQKMASMSPKDYVTAYLKLLAVVTPRRTDVSLGTDGPPVDFTINVVPNPNPDAGRTTYNI